MGILRWLSGLFKPNVENAPNVAAMKTSGDVAGLINALDDSSHIIQKEAETALIELGNSAVEPLLSVLDSGSVMHRMTVANILVKIADPRCIEPFIRLLNEKPAGLRQIAVSELAKFRTDRSIEALCQTLKDADGYLRLLAAQALEANPDARAVAPLIQVAQDPNTSSDVQTILRKVLDREAANVPIDALRQATQMNDSYVLIFAQVETSCTFRTYNVTNEACDFTQIKQMARQELIRRGLDA